VSVPRARIFAVRNIVMHTGNSSAMEKRLGMFDGTSDLAPGATYSHPTKQPEDGSQTVGYSHLTDPVKDAGQFIGYRHSTSRAGCVRQVHPQGAHRSGRQIRSRLLTGPILHRRVCRGLITKSVDLLLDKLIAKMEQQHTQAGQGWEFD